MWQTVKISDVCTIKGRIGYRGYTKGDLVEPGEGAISLSPSNIISNKINFTKSTYISWEKYYESPEIMLEIDDIVFCKTASIGKLAIVEDLPVETTLNPQFVVLKNISCDNRFLYYAIQSPSFSSQISGIIGGTAIPTLSQKNLGELAISLPPLAEQQRIVAKLDAAFAEIDSAIKLVETKQANAEKLKASLLDVSLKGDDAMWKTVKLGDVLKTGAGGTPLKSKKSYYEGGTIKWLLSGAVCERDIKDSKTHITEDGLANSSAKLFSENTVLVAMYGATAGQVGILRTKAATNQAVCGIYPSEDYLPEFLYYYLTNYKDTLLLEVSGVAQPNLSQIKIKNIQIPLVSLAEQQRIVAKLDAAFTEIETVFSTTKLAIDNYTALKSSLLTRELNPSEAA